METCSTKRPMTFNLADMFEAAVDAFGDREYLVAAGERRTFAEMEARANRLAPFLTAQGHQAESGPNAADLLPELPDLRLVIAIEDDSGQPLAEGTIPFEEAMAAGSPERDFGPRSNDDHYILYTGGTTGMPKGVVWRHQDVFYALGGGVDPHTNTRIQHPKEMVAKGQGGQITLLPIAPLMHGATQWSVIGQSFVGNRTILVPKFDPHEVWRLVESEKANSIMITGDAMGKPLIEALDDPGADYDLSSLLAVTSSAALFSAPVKDEFFKHLPNIVIVDAIGSSESGNNGMVTMGKDNTAMKSGPTVSVLGNTVVFDENLVPVEPGSGVIGKIARFGDIPVGYYNDPVKTAEVFIHVDGIRYVMPGDFATVEEDGSVTLLGRGSACINSGGEKIFPEEADSAVRSHPDVFDAIVVGAPDDRGGQRVAAIIQPRTGKHPSLEDIQVHCREHIAGYKVPRELHEVETILRSPSGKPDYRWAADIVTNVPKESDSGGARTASGR